MFLCVGSADSIWNVTTERPMRSLTEDSLSFKYFCSVLLVSVLFLSHTLIIARAQLPLLTSHPPESASSAGFPRCLLLALDVGFFGLSGRKGESAAASHLITVGADVGWQLMDSCQDVDSEIYSTFRLFSVQHFQSAGLHFMMLMSCMLSAAPPSRSAFWSKLSKIL